MILLSPLVVFSLFVLGHNEPTQQPNMFQILQKSCVISTTEYTSDFVIRQLKVLLNVSLATEIKEGRIHYLQTELASFSWPNGDKMNFMDSKERNVPESSNIEFFIIPKQTVDRTCLLKPPVNIYPNAFVPSISSLDKVASLLENVNTICNFYRQTNGYLSPEGLHREEILRTLFHTHSVSKLTMRKLTLSKTETNENMVVTENSLGTENCARKPTSSHSKSCTSDEEIRSKHSKYSTYKADFSNFNNIPVGDTYPTIPKCEEINYIPTKEEFFHNYLKISKPVVIRNAVKSWPAFQKWSNEYLREKYTSSEVHIKLTPGGEFEGVEDANLWEDYKRFKIPKDVKEQLQFPDLVVVRPAVLNVNFTDFLDIVESVSNGSQRNISAYLEYSSIPQYLPELEADIFEFQFISDLLKREHMNLWLSDGNTLGKLHFDPFDNLLCQISGTKEVIMFEPHNNTQLYEAHIPEAILSYNRKTNQFKKKKLLDSTSMVMSPVDIKKPDYKRFPLFADTFPLNCTIEEGDVLFMPSYWWHEVQSYPNKSAGRNLAVNYWYEPFLKKEVPCAECPLDINPTYNHLL